MEIGGYDIVLNTTNISELIEIVRKSWPYLVDYSDAETGDFFIFKNSSYLKVWYDRGFNPDDSNTMFHFIVGDDTTTLVCDDKDDSIVKALVHYAEPFYDSYPK